MSQSPFLGLAQRVSALELAVFALCKTAADKDGLILEVDRLMAGLVPKGPEQQAHFDEIKRLLGQYRAYAEIGKGLRPGQ